ncbi:signal peptidase I [Parasporobacterium paucivorans]|uniref:Signal peptidase I n=1 Tax=Parasporobacterium paucivorans DSM 15970 TaxID=1122934 RepID=A0A1M6HLH1_9FIRM|nr:signal peptidase I [Parasporobacterium paucivorans]SHJ23043.1 signal peptidase I [Parasporobacterium paucivorans DSM 15970]
MQIDDEPGMNTDGDSSRLNRQKELIGLIKLIAAAFIVALLIKNLVIINALVTSGSMENTIMTDTRMLGFRLAYVLDKPERGDIILFRYPDDESQTFVKRVIGLPGETLEIVDGLVYIDGSEVPLEEPYLKEAAEGSFGPFVVPAGCYFVMGDNRNDSLDSRFWRNKYVEEDNILGQAFWKYWPKPAILE